MVLHKVVMFLLSCEYLIWIIVIVFPYYKQYNTLYCLQYNTLFCLSVYATFLSLLIFSLKMVLHFLLSVFYLFSPSLLFHKATEVSFYLLLLVSVTMIFCRLFTVDNISTENFIRKFICISIFLFSLHNINTNFQAEISSNIIFSI